MARKIPYSSDLLGKKVTSNCRIKQFQGKQKFTGYFKSDISPSEDGCLSKNYEVQEKVGIQQRNQTPQ